MKVCVRPDAWIRNARARSLREANKQGIAATSLGKLNSADGEDIISALFSPSALPPSVSPSFSLSTLSLNLSHLVRGDALVYSIFFRPHCLLIIEYISRSFSYKHTLRHNFLACNGNVNEHLLHLTSTPSFSSFPSRFTTTILVSRRFSSYSNRTRARTQGRRQRRPVHYGTCFKRH